MKGPDNRHDIGWKGRYYGGRVIASSRAEFAWHITGVAITVVIVPGHMMFDAHFDNLALKGYDR